MMESQPRARPIDPYTSLYGHSRSRTTSSNVFPTGHPNDAARHPQQYHQQQHPAHSGHQHHHQLKHFQGHQQPLQHHAQPHQMHPSSHQPLHGHQQHHQQQQPQASSQHWRRSPSINTFSTQSSFQPPAAYRTSSNSDLRRSTSSRSVGTMSQQPSGYVALLRKQKATVWCERAQYEDPRTAAQQRAAKMRANREVVSGNAGRTSTGLVTTSKVAAKIRHHGKNAVVGYAPGDTHVGVGGVPVRLSATEVEGDGSDDDDGPTMARNQQHRRTGSSDRNSSSSGRRAGAAQYRSSGGAQSQRQSAGSTPDRTGSMATQPLESSNARADDAASGRAQSSGSGGSASERRDDVGELGVAPKAATNALLNAALTREKSVKTAEELRRRGSVDERTATLTSGRLYIANPD